MSQRPNMHSWLIPINLLQLEEFPLKWRVLMAMAKFMNRKRECWASAAKLCLVIGEVDDNGSPSASGLKAVRAARQALTKGGIITHYTVVEDAETQHRWRLNFSKFKPGLADYLDKEGVPLDRWADAEASEAEASEPKAAPTKDKPKVAKPKEVVEEEEEVVEGPSAADLALRQAVLARARAEAEEAERREAEEAPPEPSEAPPEPSEAPAGKRKSAFTWDMIGL